MIDRNTPSDPRLRERRGDLTGLNALLFAVVVVAAIGVIAWVLFSVLPAGGGPSPSPSPTRSPSAGPSASPSSQPSVSPSPSQTTLGSPVVGTPAELKVDTEVVASITVAEPSYRPRVAGETAPDGTVWAVVGVRYEAAAPIDYRSADWQVIDSAGDRHDWSGVQLRDALGEGHLEAGEEAVGFVAFLVAKDEPVTAVVLRSEDGDDLLIFRVP